MRIIPGRTKVSMEIIKGLGLKEIGVLTVGGLLCLLVFLSELEVGAKAIISIVIAMIFLLLVMSFDEDKTYMVLLYVLKFMTSKKVYTRKEKQLNDDKENDKDKTAKKKEKGKTEADIYSITPFTGIEDNFILYSGKYYGVVIEIPSIEFRFLNVNRQNAMIDRMLGSILRSIPETQSAELVKIDRPIIYDNFIDSENQKIEELKEAYVNGLLKDDEITSRVEIIYDRIDNIKELNYKDKVVKPFHYMVLFDDNKDSLMNRAYSAISTFRSSDMNACLLDGKELAVFLKYNYTIDFDEREIENITPDKYMDWILPKKIEFTSRMVKFDDLITYNFRVSEYPKLVANAWGHQLFNIPGTRAVMKMKPVERYKAVNRIDRALEELRTQEEETAKASRLIELSTHVDTLANLLSTLQSENEVLFDVNIFLTIYDYELTDRLKYPDEYKNAPPLNPLKRKIKREILEDGFRTTDMFMQQMDAYISTQVSARDKFISKSRGIHSSSVAALFPYVYWSLFDEGGFYIGDNGGLPVFANFFKRDKERVNSNMVIIGKSGSGKSFSTKAMLANLAADNSKVFVLDPENEYQGLAQNLNGKLIDVGSATQGRMNPFHVITTIEDDEGDEEGGSSFNVHLQFLEEFFRQILPGINNDALEYLNNIIVSLYKEKGIDEYTDLSTLTAKDFPIFDDLYDKICREYKQSKNEYSQNNLRILMNYISKFSKGGRNAMLWNGESTISVNENFIVFDFQTLLANKNNIIANAQMLLVLKWLDNEIIKNRDYNIKYGANRKIIVVIDEAHVFIDAKHPVALDFMYQLAKRIRKYNGMQIIITQNVKDFVGTEELARKSTAIINACQYSFIFSLSPNDMSDLCRLYEKAGEINEGEQEEIIGNGRGRAFLITSPSNRTGVDIVASEELQSMF